MVPFSQHDLPAALILAMIGLAVVALKLKCDESDAQVNRTGRDPASCVGDDARTRRAGNSFSDEREYPTFYRKPRDALRTPGTKS